MSTVNLNIEFEGQKLENIIVKYENTVNVLKANNIKRIGAIVVRYLKNVAKEKNWKTIAPAIISTLINDNEILIHSNSDKAKLMGWLHSGTKRHFVAPKSAKVLSWVSGRQRYFSKGHFVSGIKATNFFTVTPDLNSQINNYIGSIKGLFLQNG
jgi:hypothetical protein